MKRYLPLLAVALVLVGCGGSGGKITAARPEANVSPSASASPSPSPSPSLDTTDRPARFPDEAITYENDLEVTVLSAKQFTPSRSAAGAQPGHLGVLVKVRITNGGTATWDASLAQVALAAGPDGEEAEKIYDTDKGIGLGFTGSIAPGKSKTAPFGFSVDVANVGDVMVEVTPDFETSAGLFEGAAAP